MIRPLAVAGFSALAALLMALYILPSAAFVPLAVLLLVLAGLFGLAARLRQRRTGHLSRGVWLMLLAAGLALLRLGAAQQKVEKLLCLDDGAPHTLEGALLTMENGLYEGVYGGQLQVTVLDGAPCAPFRVRCSDLTQGKVGQQLRLTARLQVFSGGYRQQQYANGVWLRAMQTEPGTEQVLGQGRGFAAVSARLRMALGRQFLPLGRSLGGVAAAMVAGDDSYLAEGTAQLYRRAGITHLLVVSGLHISLVCSALLWALYRLLPDRRLAVWLTIPLILGYMLLMGLSPSVVRAGVLCLLALVGLLALRPLDGLTTMGLALILLLLQNPYAACDLGLLLSFGATLGVLCFATLDGRHFHLAQRGLWGRVLSALGSTLAATLFTLPVLAVNGTSISPATLLCNLLCVPLVLPIMVVGTVYLLTHLVTGAPGLMLSGHLLKTLLSLQELAATLATGLLDIRYGVTGPMAAMVLVLAALCAFVVYNSPRRRYTAAAGIGTLACLWALAAVLNIGTVRIALVGTGINPAVVVSRDGACVVLLRGDDNSLADVQEYLENHTLNDPELVVELSPRDRANAPHSLGEPDVYVPGQTYAASYTCLDDVLLTTVRQKQGCLAFLTVDGCTVGLNAGPADLSGYPACSVYLAGNSRPTGLHTDLLLRGEKVPPWLAELETRPPVYTGTTPCLWLRPGKALRVLDARTDTD